MAKQTPPPRALFPTVPVKIEPSRSADTTAGVSHSVAPGSSSNGDRGDGRGAISDRGGSRDHKPGFESLSGPSSPPAGGRRVHPRPNFGQVGNKAEALGRPDGFFPPWACQICGRASHRDPETCKFRFLTQSRAPGPWGRQTGSGGEGRGGVGASGWGPSHSGSHYGDREAPRVGQRKFEAAPGLRVKQEP
jgi:hypothetical protein